jgi:tetratricopeptide (TPR) repeat protein
VSDYLSNINNNVEQLLRYIIFLDPEFISIINELQRNKLFEAWDNVNQWRKITINGKKYLAHTDLSKNSKWLFEFYKTMQKLEIYLSSNYYSKIKSYRNKATRAYFDFDDYLQAIEYNKKILKINKSDKYALFYLGASYIKILQIDKGVEYLKKALEIYPDFKPFIKSNIKNKNAVKQVFQESD